MGEHHFDDNYHFNKSYDNNYDHKLGCPFVKWQWDEVILMMMIMMLMLTMIMIMMILTLITLSRRMIIG